MGPELETGALNTLLLRISLVAAVGASARAEAAVLVLSRHSGAVLQGVETPIRVSGDSGAVLALLRGPGGQVTTRTVAEAARIEASARPDGARTFSGPGWKVDLDVDRIIVRSDPDLDLALGSAERADGAASVQVFGLVGPERVDVRCQGTGVRTGGASRRIPEGWQTLSSLVGGGGAIFCAGGAWEVRVSGGAPRAYAGSFVWDPAPSRATEAGATHRQARARRGSDVVFVTTLGAYATGVLAAEHDGLGGAARDALLRVVAHDARADRHPGRAPCDTTHCQVFRGTVESSPSDRRVLGKDALPSEGWLPYFRGGTESWAARRSVGQVRAALGDVVALSGEGQQLQVTTAEGTSTRPCEPVRSALRLPGCPRSAVFDGQTVQFRGVGQGHGLGLDVDAAAHSNLDARTLLERAYGLHLRD